MPKIKTFAPSWLSKPAPGRKLFEPSGDDIKSSSSLGYGKKPKPGPRRVIAKRGTEIFVAVGKQIRWADLVDLKESCETKQTRIGGAGFEVYDEEAAKAGLMEGGYRVSDFIYLFPGWIVQSSWASTVGADSLCR